MAKRMGLTAIAFADHNSIGSVEEGITLSGEFGINFIPCLELNSLFKENDLHILGYFIDHKNHKLISWLEEIHREKELQAKKRIEKLNALGFVFIEEDVRKFSQGRIPTGASLLKAILSRKENQNDPRLTVYTHGERSESPYVNFYLDYLRGGKPAFVPLEMMETPLVIQKIKEFGGIPILAHPSDTQEDDIITLISRGLCGLEVYSSYHTPEQERHFLATVTKYNLVATAGSDFHGEAVKPDVKLAGIRGNEEELVKKLKEFKQRIKKS
jgi:hypothetical protein